MLKDKVQFKKQLGLETLVDAVKIIRTPFEINKTRNPLGKVLGSFLYKWLCK